MNKIFLKTAIHNKYLGGNQQIAILTSDEGNWGRCGERMKSWPEKRWKPWSGPEADKLSRTITVVTVFLNHKDV